MTTQRNHLASISDQLSALGQDLREPLGLNRPPPGPQPSGPQPPQQGAI